MFMLLSKGAATLLHQGHGLLWKLRALHTMPGGKNSRGMVIWPALLQASASKLGGLLFLLT